VAVLSSTSLDSYKHNRNRFCGLWSLKGILNVKEQKRVRYVRLGCKAWGCPICGPKKARRYRYAISRCAVEKSLDRFLTLTLDPSKCPAEYSIKYIRICWSKFRTYLKRRYSVSVSFITVLELQKNGYAHLHILIDRYVPQSWISDSWQAVGGGKIVFIKKVDKHRISKYLTKYLTKELLKANVEEQPHVRYRRVTTSRDIKLFIKQKHGEWILMTVPIEYLYSEFAGPSIGENRDDNEVLHWFETLVPALS